MFRLLKKTSRKIADWELSMLTNTINQLPDKFKHLNAQIEEGLFNRALINQDKTGTNYVTFTFAPNLINEFENIRARDYKIIGIQLYDKLNNKQLTFTLYIYSGVISGYSIDGAKKYDIDVAKIETKSFKQVFTDNQDFKKLGTVLSKKEIELINENEVYEVILNNKTYYHLQDLEDGDFIGIDTDKNIYQITHDPFEIKPLDKSLDKVLSNS